MKLSVCEVSHLRSADLKRIKVNVLKYFLEHSSTYAIKISEKEYIESINTGLKKASRYGLNTEYSLIKYISLIFMYSNRFDEQSEIRRMLAEEEMTANNKINVVLSNLNKNNIC